MFNLKGTGGPRQTVIETAPFGGGPRIYHSPTKTPGVAQQTVYTPTGGLNVLVGTGGPTQTVNIGHHFKEQHSSSSEYHGEHIDNLSPGERKKYDNRGDIPGYMIPGYNQNGRLLLFQLLTVIFYVYINRYYKSRNGKFR